LHEFWVKLANGNPLIDRAQFYQGMVAVDSVASTYATVLTWCYA